jgi:hypothetical protein
MPDTTAPFAIINGLSLTGNAVVNFSGSGVPDFDEILVSAGTTGSLTWQTAGNFVHVSGLSRSIFPIPANAISASTASGATGIVFYAPFAIHSTISTKFSVCSAGTNPTATTYLAKVYACDPNTGGPTGAPIGDYGNTTVTTATNTQFLSSSAVTLNPGMYWVGYVPSITASTALRVYTADTIFTQKTMGIQTPTSATYTLGFTGFAPLPSTIGTVTEFLSSTPICPLLQIQ